MQTQLNTTIYSKFSELCQTMNIKSKIISLDNIDYSSLIRNNFDTNKGIFGSVAIIGGNTSMVGALCLAGHSALRCGAGKVILASLESKFQYDVLMPELMVDTYTNILKNLDKYSVVVVGPGLGLDDTAHYIIKKIIQSQAICNFIFDADALNIIASNPQWHADFAKLPNKIITPHPLEAARLLNTSIAEIQDNRILAIKALYDKYNAFSLLKGYGSLVYSGELLYINPTGNPGMSNAGQGDTLNGIIAALIAQKMELTEALCFAVYLHGLAGDTLAQALYPGYIGILGSDISIQARLLLNQILTKNTTTR